MPRPRNVALALVVAGSLAGSGALPAAPIRAQDTATTTETGSTPMDAVAVVDQTLPAVVTVINEQRAPQFAPGLTLPGQEADVLPAGVGTGFILDEQGHVVTNEHVVAEGDSFQVILQSGERRPAQLVGADPLSDVAVIRIEGAVPATLPLGNSDELQIGQSVLAMGSPLGSFNGTVTEGIVGSLNRDFPLTPGSAAYSNLIQHDAAINPGNSGGPLVDANGNVVGINTLGVVADAQGNPVQGLFFAIPSNTVQRITQTLIESGQVDYPYLGVEVRQITPDLANLFELSVDYGAYVAGVERGGPAQQAGIEEGDIITAIGGQAIDRENTFSELLFAHQPGEQVEVTFQRDGAEQTVAVTLGERQAGD